MIGTLIILYALNSIAPIPTSIFAVAWVIMFINIAILAVNEIINSKKK